MPPYDQLDQEIRNLISEGCSQNEVFQQLLSRYPQIVSQAAEVLKRIQAIERVFSSFEPSPGRGQPLPSRRYRCPHCAETGERFDESEPIPNCPICNIPMEKF